MSVLENSEAKKAFDKLAFQVFCLTRVTVPFSSGSTFSLVLFLLLCTYGSLNIVLHTLYQIQLRMVLPFLDTSLYSHKVSLFHPHYSFLLLASVYFFLCLNFARNYLFICASSLAFFLGFLLTGVFYSLGEVILPQLNYQPTLLDSSFFQVSGTLLTRSLKRPKSAEVQVCNFALCLSRSFQDSFVYQLMVNVARYYINQPFFICK